MIQKIYESYDDSNYYINYNEKKLATENLKTIGGMLTFFIAVSVVFVALAMGFGNGLRSYYKFFPPVGILVVLAFINAAVVRRGINRFRGVRAYAFVIYAMVILSFSFADARIYTESRAVFFPAAILVICSLYTDYMFVMIGYKVVLTIAFIFIECHYKTANLIINDATVALFAIIVSSFCQVEVVRSALGTTEDNLELVHKSETDLLTGLLNKLSFENRCRDYIDRKMAGAKCTMFIFDLDDFKLVNDNYGHQAGDDVISTFSQILQGYFHPDDLIGRIGGDEFMVFVLGEMVDGFAERRCRSILHELKTTQIGEVKGVTCSIGIVEDTQRTTFEELYKKADEALYKAKEGGKAQFCLLQNNPE